jgi:DNA modification methylase
MKPEPYYQDEFVTLYCGDNRQIAPLLGSFDLLLTDPPYGIEETNPSNARRGRGSKDKPTKFGVCSWDSKPPSWFLEQLISMAGYSIIWGGNYFGLPASPCWLVWDKDNTGDFADCELAWTNSPRAVRKFVWRWNGMLQENMKNKENRVHPTQKPLPLMHWCLTLVPEVIKTVFDPYAGSGTTLLAAKQKGLIAVGIEIDEQYCERAVERLNQKTIWEAE